MIRLANKPDNATFLARMILPTVYLESSVAEKTVDDFMSNLTATTLSEWPLHLFVEKGAEALAEKIRPALEGLAPAVHQHSIAPLGRNKSFKPIAFAMQQHGKGWLFLEPGRVKFTGDDWFQKLAIEYGGKLLASGTTHHFLGAQIQQEDGPISPLCGVWPANIYEQSILIKYPSVTPEIDMRWEVRRIFRKSDVISAEDGAPVYAKLGRKTLPVCKKK